MRVRSVVSEVKLFGLVDKCFNIGGGESSRRSTAGPYCKQAMLMFAALFAVTGSLKAGAIISGQ